MGRIRTVKPEVAKHELLFQMELELKAPIRFAWVMLPGQCDREGRFKWRPGPLKTDILPYDEIDFSRVLDAWLTRGFLVKYRVGSEWYGLIPTFRKHQAVNPRESPSTLPSLKDADEVIDHTLQTLSHASPTRPERVIDASSTRHDLARGEGKGREGKGTEIDHASGTRAARRCPTDWNPTDATLTDLKRECPGVDLQREFAKFRDHEFARPKKDWTATFRNWIRRASELKPAGRNGTHSAEERRQQDARELEQLKAKRADLGIPEFRDPFLNESAGVYDTQMRMYANQHRSTSKLPPAVADLARSKTVKP